MSWLLLLLFPVVTFAANFPIGKVTQLKGSITYLNYAPHSAVKPVALKQEAMTDGSFLTQDSAYMVITLFDGSYIRLNPKSKISFEYDEASGTITTHLYSGSIKVYFHHPVPNPKAQKIIVKSADTSVETVEAKFSVVKSLLEDTSSVYVEKGAALVSLFEGPEKKDSEIVHAREMTSTVSKTHDIETPRPMTEKQLKFLQPTNYLR